MTDRAADRRQHARVGATLRVDYASADELRHDYLTDLSEGGLFIRTTLALQVGQRLDFSVSFPGLLDPIALHGIVRWRAEAPAYRIGSDAASQLEEVKQGPGVGVEFVFDDQTSRDRVRGLAQRFRQVDAKQVVAKRRFRMLLVDDSGVVRDLFCEALKRMTTDPLGARACPEIVTASDGKQALELLTDPAQQFDLAIIDHYLPEMDGLTLLRLLRADPRRSTLPVIMISVDPETVERSALRSGANVFLPKPIQAQSLIRTVSAFISELAADRPR
jgi:two-component system chemotaxis response regulator CheY